MAWAPPCGWCSTNGVSWAALSPPSMARGRRHCDSASARDARSDCQSSIVNFVCNACSALSEHRALARRRFRQLLTSLGGMTMTVRVEKGGNKGGERRCAATARTACRPCFPSHDSRCEPSFRPTTGGRNLLLARARDDE